MGEWIKMATGSSASDAKSCIFPKMSPSSSSHLLPIENVLSKPIPSGTKVRFRWHNDGVNKTSAAAQGRRDHQGHSRPNQHPRLSGAALPSSLEFSPSSSDSADSMSADQLLDTQLVALRSRSSLDRSPLFAQSKPQTGSSAEFLSAGLLLLSLSGFLLLIFLGFCLFRMFQRDEEEDGHGPYRSRELQVVLVPKQRPPNRRPSLVHPQQASSSNGQQNNSIAAGGQQKPFPKRIYEIQAEEGYFSSPPSKRASFDFDGNGSAK